MTISAHNREFGRLGIFIDGNNLFHAARSVGIEIDYARLLGVFCKYGPLVRAFFYTGVDENASKQQGFLLWMKRNGYRVIQKDLKVTPEGNKKAYLDIEIVVDMMALSPHIDTVILVSGDEDFAYAMNHLINIGKQVILSGFRVNTSPALMDVADYYLDLENYLDEIAKDHQQNNNFVNNANFHIQQNQVKTSTLASRHNSSNSMKKNDIDNEPGILDD